MEITHVAENDDGSVTVTWNMTGEEYKQLIRDAMMEVADEQTLDEE